MYLELEERLKKQNILNMYACIAYTDNEDGHLTNNSMQFHEHMGFRLMQHYQKSAVTSSTVVRYDLDGEIYRRT